MLSNQIKTFFISCLCLALTACGFHLRGSAGLPPQLKVMYIEAAPYSALTLTLKQTLHSAGVTIAENASSAPITLQILNEQFNQQLMNISANTFVNTYNLNYVVTLQLLNSAGTVIYGPVTVQTTSNFAVSSTQIVGDNNQLLVQKQTMQQDAVGLIFNRLNSIDAQNAIQKSTT